MDGVTIGMILFFFGFLVLDTLRPARAFPKMKAWPLRGVLSFVFYAVLATALPFVWDETLGQYRLIDATKLGTVGGAMVGIIVVEFISYGWHRAMHKSDFLWRWFHQMHHSSERIDVASTFIFSPLDIVGWTFVGSLGLVWALGLTPQAAVLANVIAFGLAVFTHANIRTPQWVGYLVQRPESHTVHHKRGVHTYNYSTLPVWDMLFGTFRNPKEFSGEVGFYDGASTRIKDMLLGRDVSAPVGEQAQSLISGLVETQPGTESKAPESQWSTQAV